YDVSKPLNEYQIARILEFGRLTPTSFGLELWAFHVVKSQQKLEALFHACFDQETVGSSVFTVAVLVRTAAFANPDSELVKSRAGRFGDPLKVFIDDYRPYYEFLKQENRLGCWLKSQGYLAVANMMTGACTLGIQSCAIEGFDEQKVLDVLKVSSRAWQVSLLATFGYSMEEERPKIRESLDSLTVYH
ncbi:MAG: NAD(P)H-dependent oxidoreductase, partial [Spirochaetia bacterium]|nr:NAD(P)H-dependent oxidoreductase [Spirochaetia bacterium]